MTPLTAPALSESAALVCFVSILLVPLAGAGLALINTGLGRSRGASHLITTSLAALSIAAIVYCICGFAWQGYFGSPGYQLTISGRGWNWIASEPFFLRGISLNGSPQSLAVLLGMVTAGLAALIPIGAGADRWRFGSICASTALLAGWTYPLFAHWVWGAGWLAQLGINAGLGHGFVDVGGSSTIQAVGGLTALSVAWILGPRQGKYTLEGMPSAIPGHNGVFVAFGCLLALVGWSGLNTAGTLLFTGIEPGRAVLIVITTTLSAAAAFLTAVIITRIRFGRPDASLSANGWVGGLAASSAGCAFVTPASAMAIGVIAGVLVIFSVEWLELRLGVDDPGGAISAHALGGIWGVLSVGIFANLSGFQSGAVGSSSQGAAPAPSGQWLAQLIGIATLIGFVLPLTYSLNWLLNRFFPQRVAAEGERQGLDLYEFGSGAYPDFLTHSDEFTQRKI